MYPKSVARIVSNTSRFTSITRVPEKLQLLPGEYRSVFKTAKLGHKFLHTGFPKYIAPYVFSYGSSYSTRHRHSW